MVLYQVSVFLHVLSAIIWVGGMLFLALVIVPSTRDLPPADRAALFSAVGRRFRTIGWVCIVVLVTTGLVNSAYRGVTWANLFTADLWGTPFGTTLALKLGVVLVMLGLSVYHDFVIGPRSVRMSAHTAVVPDALKETRRLRKRAAMIGRLEALLVLVVLVLAIMLVRGVPSLF